jgi:hypothetical protein
MRACHRHETDLRTDVILAAFSCARVRNWHVLENEAFVVLADASCIHR